MMLAAAPETCAGLVAVAVAVGGGGDNQHLYTIEYSIISSGSFIHRVYFVYIHEYIHTIWNVSKPREARAKPSSRRVWSVCLSQRVWHVWHASVVCLLHLHSLRARGGVGRAECVYVNYIKVISIFCLCSFVLSWATTMTRRVTGRVSRELCFSGLPANPANHANHSLKTNRTFRPVENTTPVERRVSLRMSRVKLSVAVLAVTRDGRQKNETIELSTPNWSA